MNIAIYAYLCDDRKNIINEVQTFFANKQTLVHFSEFSTEHQFCDISDESIAFFDLIIMDISKMEAQSIKFTQELRDKGINCQIIFVAESIDYALDSYDVSALFYLVKPISDTRFQLAMERFWQNYKPKSIFIRNRLYIADQIVYCESQMKSVFIHFNNGKFVQIREKLDNIQAKLTSENFVRCHQSYIVNMDYVRDLEDGAFVVPPNKLVPFRKRELQKYRSMYHNYVTVHKTVCKETHNFSHMQSLNITQK